MQEARPRLAPPLMVALLLPPQRKKGKEAGSGAALPPPRAPTLPSEARAPHTSSPASAKRSKAKAKGKEVKKEVRLSTPKGVVSPQGPPGLGGLLRLLGRWVVPGCARPGPPVLACPCADCFLRCTGRG